MLKKIGYLAIILFLTFHTQTALANKIHHYKLKNGLQLFVKVDHTAPVVVSQIWYKVGSSYEPLGITGISHALEHMMFQGSKNYQPKKLMQIVAAHGGEQNAATSYDFTFYYQKLPAQYLELSFKLEADRMYNLILSKQRFAKEIQVVREERRLRTDNNPQALTLERFLATANIATAYHHPIIGWMNDIQHLTIEDLRHWYNQYYSPNNAILVVVGDVNPNKVYALAKKYFAKIKPKTLPIIKPQHNLSSLGKRTVIINAPAKLPMLFLGFNVPVIKTAQKPWQPYALSVIAGILDMGHSSRFKKELIRKQQIAAAAQAHYDPFDRLSSVFILAGIPTPKHNIKELEQAFLMQIKKLQTIQISIKELQKIKTQIIAQNIFMRDSLSMQAEEIGRLESVGLSWKIGKNFIDEINKITPQQIQMTAKEFLTEKRLTVAILQPQEFKK
ncbi:MAG: pitrilysin family protein [Gammaproteobacteria bacterium]|jgi:zinc protease